MKIISITNRPKSQIANQLKSHPVWYCSIMTILLTPLCYVVNPAFDRSSEVASLWYDHYDNDDEWSSFSSMHHHYHQQQQHYKSIAKFAITINRLMTIANGWGLLGLWFMRWPTRDSNQNSRLLATWPPDYRERRRLCVIGISLLPKTIGSTLCHYLFLE